MIGFGDDDGQLRAEVVAALREAVAAHERGTFREICEAYDRLVRRAEQSTDVDPDLRVAIEFLDGWHDSSNHDWQFYEPLGQPDWPRLSLSLAASLEAGEPIDEGVKERFAFAPRRGLWSRIREIFRRSA
jgi:hypothetical protein